MNAERWARVAQLYESALERPSSERGIFLAEASGGDAELQREIESLLAQEVRSGPLDRPALDGAAELLGVREGLPPGTRLGPYRLDGMIGAGGMGEVYRATDTRLDRTVALKILPGDLSIDAQFRERFEREARAVAALSHPHICTIHDVGRHEGVDFLVLEYLEGETLAARLEKGALPLDQALRHAADIADALAVAHRSAIVHRDLKPANIFITKAGAKLLDFGLAKTTAPTVVGARASDPATVPEKLTAQGTILGTFQYMAPEQLEGHAADTRTDIFAFGAVVYEMLTGRKAFEGKSQASLIGAILKDEPPSIDKSQPLTPPILDRVVRRCLAKNPDDRWQSAADLADELRWIADGRSQTTRSAAIAPVTRQRALRTFATAGTGVVLGAVVTAVAAWIIMVPSTTQAPRPARFEIIPTAAQPMSLGALRSVAISPDGAHLVYRISSGSGLQAQLLVRPMNELTGLAMAAGANHPFFSPDGRWIGFNGMGVLQKIPVTGGAALPICEVGSPERGATWAPDDTIIFATADPATGLLSVPADGGTPTVLTVPDASQGEVDHWSPSILPDGRGVLFRINAGNPANHQIAVLDLKTGQRKVLFRGTQAEYLDSGHLVYAAAGTIRVVRFDPVRLEVLGTPVTVVDQVMTTGVGFAQFSVSRDGTLVYVPSGTAGEQSPSQVLVWVDRQGTEQPLGTELHAYAAPRLSPDATRVAVQIRDGVDAVWVRDLRRDTFTPLNSDAESEMMPVWTPDGQRIIFGSSRGGPPNLYWRPADGSGAVERLTATGRPQFATSVSPDGRQIVIGQLSPGTQADVGVVVGGRTEILIQSAFQEFSPELSPDGRWLAYQSNESGQYEIYVRPFPNVNGSRWTISTGGGTRPAWARNGQELFYLDRDDRLTAVTVRADGSALVVGKPATILERSYFVGGTNYGRPYDVAPDGRFLMIKDQQKAGEPPMSPRVVVVQNWIEEVKRLMAAP